MEESKNIVASIISNPVTVGILLAASAYIYRIKEDIRKRKIERYEEFIDAVESILSGNHDKKSFDQLNQIHAKLTITASPAVLKAVRVHLVGYFDASARDPIYRAIRRDIYFLDRVRGWFGKRGKWFYFEKDRLSYFNQADKKQNRK